MKPEAEKHFIEVVAGCVWLTQELKTTANFSERGLWDTKEEARAALVQSFNETPLSP